MKTATTYLSRCHTDCIQILIARKKALVPKFDVIFIIAFNLSEQLLDPLICCIWLSSFLSLFILNLSEWYTLLMVNCL